MKVKQAILQELSFVFSHTVSLWKKVHVQLVMRLLSKISF